MKLIELLSAKQELCEYSTRQMGAVFGYTGSWWSQIRWGKRHLRAKDARRAKDVWPDLTEAVNAYLLGDNEDDIA